MARPAQTTLYLMHALSAHCGTGTTNADKCPAFNQNLRWHNWEILLKQNIKHIITALTPKSYRSLFYLKISVFLR